MQVTRRDEKLTAMGRDNVNIIAIAQGSSETNISFVVEDSAMKQALLSAHREFGLSANDANLIGESGVEELRRLKKTTDNVRDSPSKEKPGQ